MTAKEQVLKVYNEAEAKKVWSKYWGIYWCNRCISMIHESESAAWQSALTKINENGTTSNTTKEMV